MTGPSQTRITGEEPPLSRQDEEEVLVDLTERLVLRSKRTERWQKKQLKKKAKPLPETRGITDLPYELLLGIFSHLRPSDLFRVSRVSKDVQSFVALEEPRLTQAIISRRYPCLQKCFRLPALLESVDASLHRALLDEERQDAWNNSKPFQHIKAADPSFICTCPTCVHQWNSLCVVIDFAHWQGHLDRGDAIPLVPRGRFPEWNLEIQEANAAVLLKALYRPMWYAAILEAHLDSTIRSIRRQSENKGNKRRRFRMTKEDEEEQTDRFLERSGPPTSDLPFNRDNYYLLEAYLPNRAWSGEKERWMYVREDMHDMDVQRVYRWSKQKETWLARGIPNTLLTSS